MDTIGSREALDTLVASGACVLVDVADGTDPASVAFSGAVDAVASRIPEVRRARLPLPSGAELAGLFGVSRAPALLLFRAGVGLFAGPAAFDPAQLEALVKRALSLDMDQVRREMDRERAAMAASASFRACPTSKRGEFPPP
jgi:thioredoxin 1